MARVESLLHAGALQLPGQKHSNTPMQETFAPVEEGSAEAPTEEARMSNVHELTGIDNICNLAVSGLTFQLESHV